MIEDGVRKRQQESAEVSGLRTRIKERAIDALDRIEAVAADFDTWVR